MIYCTSTTHLPIRLTRREPSHFELVKNQTVKLKEVKPEGEEVEIAQDGMGLDGAEVDGVEGDEVEEDQMRLMVGSEGRFTFKRMKKQLNRWYRGRK